MPRSKHRRKPGGKAIKNPGRGRPGPMRAPAPSLDAYGLLRARVSAPFYKAWPDDPHHAGYLLDIILGESAMGEGSHPVVTWSVSKAAVFSEFVEPFENEDGTESVLTDADAEAALAFLIEQEMVRVEGDSIALHPRFDEPTAQSEGQASPLPRPGLLPS